MIEWNGMNSLRCLRDRRTEASLRIRMVRLLRGDRSSSYWIAAMFDRFCVVRVLRFGRLHECAQAVRVGAQRLVLRLEALCGHILSQSYKRQ